MKMTALSDSERGRQIALQPGTCHSFVYADRKCILGKTEPNRENALSYAYQQEEIFSIGYYVLIERCDYRYISSVAM